MITLKNWTMLPRNIKRILSDGRRVPVCDMEIEIDVRGLSNEDAQKEKDMVLRNPDFVVNPSTMAVSIDCGAPNYGSICTVLSTYNSVEGEHTQVETYIMKGDGFKSSGDLIEWDLIDGELNVVENGTYEPWAVPGNFKEAWQKVTVDVPQLDTSDATAAAGDILHPKTAYVNGAKVTGTLEKQSKTVTPTKSVQKVTPDSGVLLSDVTVNAIPAEYIIPTGSTTITTNGTHDVSEFATAIVNVNPTVGTVVGTLTQIPIYEDTPDETETLYCIEYDELKEIMDSSDELIFKLSDSQYTRPLMGVYISGNETHFEIIELLKYAGSEERTAGTKFIWVVKNGSKRLGREEKDYIHDNINSKIPYNIYHLNT